MKKSLPLLLVLGLALSIPGACTSTSIDAIGTGGFGDVGVGPVITVGTGVATIATTGVVAGGLYPESPCGSFYDWASCEVHSGNHVEPSISTATDFLADAWRRCDESGTGDFPVGVLFYPDGTVFRLFRAENPYVGSTNIVHCKDAPTDRGLWSLDENIGGGADAGFRLDIQWDDGAETSLPLVIYEGVAAFGLLHGEADADDTTERFIPEADFIPGSEP